MNELNFMHQVLPFINFGIFLAMLVWMIRQPMRDLAIDAHRKFLDKERSAKESMSSAMRELEQAENEQKAFDQKCAQIIQEISEAARLERELLQEKVEALILRIRSESDSQISSQIHEAKVQLSRAIAEGMQKAVRQGLAGVLTKSEERERIFEKMAS